MDASSRGVSRGYEEAPLVPIQQFLNRFDVIDSLMTTSIPMDTVVYLASNLVWIMDQAFQIQAPVDVRMSRICTLVLRCEDHNLIRAFERSPQFSEYLLRFARQMEHFSVTSQDMFVKYVEWMSVSQNHNFFGVVDLKELLSAFVNSLYLEASFHGMHWFVHRFYETEVKFNLKVPLVLLKEHLLRTRNSEQALALFISCLNIPHFAERTAATLLRYDVLMKGILTEALHRRNWRSVDLVNKLCETAAKFRLSPKWIRVADTITARYGDVCGLLTGCVVWCAFEKKVGKLWVMLTRRRGVVNEQTLRTVVSAVNFMFDHPVNTFEHNFTVQAVQLFIEFGGMVDVLIRRTKMVEKIMANYENIGYTDKVFWGQLRLLANMINDYVDKKDYEGWERIVVAPNRKTERIISRDYLDFYFYASNWFTTDSFRRLLRSNRELKSVIWIVAFFLVVVLYTSCFL